MVPTILLVDDEPQVTSALQHALNAEPWRIMVAHSGPEALDLLASEPVDVVISDDEMPGMNGSHLLTEARRQYPETIRMVLTSHGRLDEAVRATAQGEIYRFFLKPVSAADLAITVRQALHARKLAEENRRLQRTIQEQGALLRDLERNNPGISRVERNRDGAIVIGEE